MKKNKLKVTLIVLITAILCLSVGAYAGYTLTAKDVTYTKPDGTTISVEAALDELHEKSKTTTASGGIEQFDWDELSAIAKMISNDSSITSDTYGIVITLNEKKAILKVGDTTTVDGKIVRILGFNHDTLTNASAYGTTTATGKAGISFEYVTFLTSSGMNSSDNNIGGWGISSLRSTLNSTTYNSLSIKDKIKQVQKEFIKIYSSASSKTESSDYLWLLSCGEIWDNGYGDENTRGSAIATEGSQYKYYKSTLGSRSYSSSTNITEKPNTSSPSFWWLRSPDCYGSYSFCGVYSTGGCNANYASASNGVAPGFCI